MPVGQNICVSMEHPREISTDKPDDIIFPLKVLQNPHSYCVLQILSDPSKLIYFLLHLSHRPQPQLPSDKS